MRELEDILNKVEYRTPTYKYPYDKLRDELLLLMKKERRKAVVGFVEFVSSLKLPLEGTDILTIEGLRIVNELLFRKVDSYLKEIK